MRLLVHVLVYLIWLLMALPFMTLCLIASPAILLVCYALEEEDRFLRDYPTFLWNILKGPFYG